MVTTRKIKLETPTNFRPRKNAQGGAANTEAGRNGTDTATNGDVTRKSGRERNKPMKLRAVKNEADDGQTRVDNKTAKRKVEPKSQAVASKQSVGAKRKRDTVGSSIAPQIEDVTEEERKPKRIKISLKNGTSKKESETKTVMKRGGGASVTQTKESSAASTETTPGKEVRVKFRLDSKITSETRDAVLHFPLLSCRTQDTIADSVTETNSAKKSVTSEKTLLTGSRDREVKVNFRLGSKLQKQTCVATVPYVSKERELKVAIKCDSKVQTQNCIATVPQGIMNAIGVKAETATNSEEATDVKMSTQTGSKPSEEKSTPAIAQDPTKQSDTKLTTPFRNRCKFPNCNRYRQSHTGGYCLTHKPSGIPQAPPDAVLAAISTASSGDKDKESTKAARVTGGTRNPKQPKATPDSHRCKYEGCTKYRQGYTGGYCLTHKMFGTGRAKPTEDDELPPLPGVSLAQDALPPPLSNEVLETLAPLSNEDNVHNTRRKSKSSPKKETSTSLPPDHTTDVADSKKGSKPLSDSQKCIVEGCTRYKRSRNGGYCLAHKHLWDGIEEPVEIKIAPKMQQCRFEGCVKYKRSRNGGYCLSHKHLWDGREETDKDVYFSTLSGVGADSSIPPLPDVELPDMDDLMNEAMADMHADIASPLLMHGTTSPDKTINVPEQNINNDVSPALLPPTDVFVGFGLEPLQPVKTSDVDEGHGSSKMDAAQSSALDLTADPLPSLDNSSTLPSEPEVAKPLSTDNQDEKKDLPESILKTEPCVKIDAHTTVQSNNNASADPLETTVPVTHQDLNTSLVLPPGIEIKHPSQCKDSKKRSLCKVVGCKKLDQSSNKGFCRSHYNLVYAGANLPENQADPWVCVCGQEVSGKQKRCGACFRWKGGVREAYSIKPYNITGANKNNVSNGRETTEIKTITTALGKEILEEYWTCSECGNQVDEHKSRCGLCHHWRGGKREVGWNLCTKERTNSSNDWECCGETIPARKTRCGKCRGWRGGKRLPRWGSDGAHGDNDSAEDEEENVDYSIDWTCQKCNNINLGKKKRCKKCCSWRFPRKMKARVSEPLTSSFDDNDSEEEEGENGHWICKACSYDNFGSEFKCLMCKQNRPNWKKYNPESIPTNSSNSETLSGLTLPDSLVAANNATAKSRKQPDLDCDGIPVEETASNIILSKFPDANAAIDMNEQLADPSLCNNESSTEPAVTKNVSTQEGHITDDRNLNDIVATDKNSMLGPTLNTPYINNTENTDSLVGHSSYDYGSSYLHSDFLDVTPSADLGHNLDEKPSEYKAASRNEESKVSDSIVHV